MGEIYGLPMTIHLFRFSIISYLGQHTTGNSHKIAQDCAVDNPGKEFKGPRVRKQRVESGKHHAPPSNPGILESFGMNPVRNSSRYDPSTHLSMSLSKGSGP